jgi:PPOX class probable F420-dependent enzyme
MSNARSKDANPHIPTALIDLLEGDALGHLATVRANGTPHVTPLWVDHDGDAVLVNVRLDRVKAANMRERPDVAISIVDPRNPYRYLAITGRVASWSEDGWQEHMNKLARRYMKVDRYPWFFPGEQRAIFRIVPTNVYYEMGDT